MKKIDKKGFTLIELLVVIAIIGLLSTMAVISLNSARAKARDAKRLSDVKQLATTLSLEASNSDTAPLGCAAGTLTTACTTGVGQVATEFPKFKDPSAPAATPCTVASAVPCGYAIYQTDRVGSTTIMFAIENSAPNGLSAGKHTINTEGIIN